MKTTLMFRFVLLHLIVLTLLRIVFYYLFASTEDFQTQQLVHSFWLGCKYDLRFILILELPLILFSWGRWNPFDSPKMMKSWQLFYTLIGTSWMIFYSIDFGFYSYLKSRVNSTIFINLENPDIALKMVWQSYPVVWSVIGIFLALFLYKFLLHRFVFRPFQHSFFYLPPSALFLSFTMLLAVGLYGNMSQYPLRWSDAFFSPNQVLSHLALNPVLYFIETYPYSHKKTFDLKEVKKHYNVIAPYLGVKKLDKNKLNFAREEKANAVPFRPNVVFIIMESLALSKTNLMEAPLKPTPFLEELAQDSYWFSQYYSPAEGTARNIFSIMTAIPDVTQEQSSSRNPMVVDQKLIANAYKDYHKMYFLGGSASWANIRGMFTSNIDRVEIYEDSSGLNKPRTDVWGVSDYDLFLAADEKFKSIKNDEPFFAVIQAASFHRPFSINPGLKGFHKKEASAVQLKESGFFSLDQYNSLRFTDFSLETFFKMAQKSDYYKNTIFVVTGDHGLPDDGGINVSPGSRLWWLEKYHVPLIIHNKQLLPTPTEDSRPSGHMDLMTTVASIAGISHINTTLGRNLFDHQLDNERYAFIFNYFSSLGEYGLLDGEFYYHYDSINKGRLFKYKTDDPGTDVKNEFPQNFKRMDDIAQGFYSTAHYLLLNNQKDK